MELASIDSLQDPNDRTFVTSYSGPLTLYFYRHTYIYALFNYILTNTYMHTHTHQTHPYTYQAYKKLTYIYTSVLTKHTPI